MKLFAAIVAALGPLGASAYGQVKATIVDVNGATKGFVEIEGQKIKVSLDAFSAPCGLNGNLETNLTGLGWHIHEKWGHVAGFESGFGGEQCSAKWTGGHYDPTYACGPFSEYMGTKCNNGTHGCVGPSSASMDENIATYTCNPTSAGYIEQPFQCEVGDLSGKFGTHSMGAVATHDDPYMPGADRLANRSIVFHCAAGRIFCGKLVWSEHPTGTVPTIAKPVDSVQTLTAMFHPTVGSRASIGSFVLKAESITSDIDLSRLTAESIATAAAATCEGGTLQWHIHERWKHTNGRVAALGAEACGMNFTSNHYDPLMACSPFSHNHRCMAGGGCVSPSSSRGMDRTAYGCNFTHFPYSCEVGDLSGKYGDYQIAADGSSSFAKYGVADFLPPLSTLVGKSLVYHCDGKRSFCAELSASTPHEVMQATFQYDADGAGAAQKKRAIGFVVLDGPETSIELGALSFFFSLSSLTVLILFSLLLFFRLRQTSPRSRTRRLSPTRAQPAWRTTSTTRGSPGWGGKPPSSTRPAKRARPRSSAGTTTPALRAVRRVRARLTAQRRSRCACLQSCLRRRSLVCFRARASLCSLTPPPPSLLLSPPSLPSLPFPPAAGQRYVPVEARVDVRMHARGVRPGPLRVRGGRLERQVRPRGDQPGDEESSAERQRCILRADGRAGGQEYRAALRRHDLRVRQAREEALYAGATDDGRSAAAHHGKQRRRRDAAERRGKRHDPIEQARGQGRSEQDERGGARERGSHRLLRERCRERAYVPHSRQVGGVRRRRCDVVLGGEHGGAL
jgi:hypothetical protein